MCPYCGQFDRAQEADLKSLVEAGTVKVVFHVMNFLDSSSNGAKYSSRAADAFVTVAKQQPSAALAFNTALYADQPAEGSSGLTDAQIADRARAAGVSDSVIATFANQPNADFVVKSNQAAFDEGIQSTPTVKINGTVFTGDLYTAGAFKAAIQAAK
jgi:protein-disulfide isomerase